MIASVRIAHISARNTLLMRARRSNNVFSRMVFGLFLTSLTGGNTVSAYDVVGILPNALGLPELNALVRPSAGAPPIAD